MATGWLELSGETGRPTVRFTAQSIIVALLTVWLTVRMTFAVTWLKVEGSMTPEMIRYPAVFRLHVF